ncbi:MAG: hypothetical protein R2741_10285 [Methanolobus sp.]
MENLKNDTKGQWIALSGLVISIILISLAALANQAIIAGYHSSNAALEFPKEDIRELKSHTGDNAIIIKELTYDLNATGNDSIPLIYGSLFNNYSTYRGTLCGSRANIRPVTCFVNNSNGTYGNNDIDFVFVNMTFNDGRILYIANPEIYEVSP